MKVGIGLPNAVRGVQRDGIVDWARRAEAAGFSSLGTIDRVAYPNYESLISLAAAAAVTERIELVTDILIPPLRGSAGVLAKQVATLDHLSGGRVVFGVAPGGREDDFVEAGESFADRGRVLDEQLERMKAIWEGQTPVGPEPAQPGGPVVMVGGSSPPAFRRAARFGDGWTMGGGTPEMFAQAMRPLHEAWRAAGREGEPRTMVLFYFALGPDAAEAAQHSLGDYYAFLGDYAANVVEGAAKDAGTVKAYLDAFEQAGCDEAICFPANPDPEQVDRLAEAAL